MVLHHRPCPWIFGGARNSMHKIDLSTVGGSEGREDTQWYTQGLAATLLSACTTQKQKMWLDVGAGLGLSKKRIEPHGFRCLTQDPAPSLPVDISNPIHEVLGAFGVVSAFDVLEHIPRENTHDFLANLRRLSDGYVVLSVPYQAESQYHFSVFSPQELLWTCMRLGDLICAYDLFDGRVERKDCSIGTDGAFGGLLIYK